MLNNITKRLQEKSQFLSDMINWGEEARKRAITDQLSGVYNRRYYDETIHNLYSECFFNQKPLSFIMIDLDHFREINKYYNLAICDSLIVEVAHVLKRYFKYNAVIIRYGGDEFIVILKDTDEIKAKNTAENVVKEIRKNDLLKNFKGPFKQITLSIGIASFPADAINMESLKKKADEALYKAKKLGRNRIVLAASLENQEKSI